MPGSGGIGVKRRVFSPGSAGEESEQGTYTKTHTDGRTQTCTQTHARTGDTRIHVHCGTDALIEFRLVPADQRRWPARTPIGQDVLPSRT